MPTPRSYYKSYSRTSYRRHNYKSKTANRKSPTYMKNSPAFRRPRMECEWRLTSYRNIYSQFAGAGKWTSFSPAAANKWLNYVNRGWHVYKWSNRDFCRYFGYQWQTGSPTACLRWMRQKYGSYIKAVTKGNGNTWLVATTPNVTARPFYNYNWK